jgi:hypothetical protein
LREWDSAGSNWPADSKNEAKYFHVSSYGEVFAALGTFSNGGAFIISAFTGYGTKLGTTINEKFPPPKGIEGVYSDAITNILMVCAVTMIAACVVALIGLVRFKVPKEG